jgi:hypothetical protein
MGGFEWGCGKVPRVVGGRHLSHRGKNGLLQIANACNLGSLQTVTVASDGW